MTRGKDAMKRLISQPTRDHCPKLRFAWEACKITGAAWGWPDVYLMHQKFDGDL
jgi:hypothetical protein